MCNRYRDPTSGELRGLRHKMDSMKLERDLREIAKLWKDGTAKQKCRIGGVILILAIVVLASIFVRGVWVILTSIKTWVIIIAISVAYIAYIFIQGGG